MKYLKIGIIGNRENKALTKYAKDCSLDFKYFDLPTQLAPAEPSQESAPTSGFETVVNLGKGFDILSIQMSDINTDALRSLEQQGTKIYPSPDIIDLLKNRYLQKKHLQAHDIPVLKATPLLSSKTFADSKISFPFYIKTCEFKENAENTKRINSAADLTCLNAEECFTEQAHSLKEQLWVTISRTDQGYIACHTPIMMENGAEQLLFNYHLNKKNITKEQTIDIGKLAIKIANSLDLKGLLAFEVFIDAEDRMYVNKLALMAPATTLTEFTDPEYMLQDALGLEKAINPNKEKKQRVQIFEPAAFRKNVIEQALETLLNVNVGEEHWRAVLKRRNIIKQPSPQVSTQDAMAKTVMIRHILNE